MFPCFVGMPQGWTLAVYFYQSAVHRCGERALGSGRALVHGSPAPDLHDGPLCSVEVDSLTTLTVLGAAAEAYSCVRREAVKMGFELHEAEE